MVISKIEMKKKMNKIVIILGKNTSKFMILCNFNKPYYFIYGLSNIINISMV